MLFEGLRTIIYQVDDLAKAKDWYSRILGFAPYFDEPFYVGFNVGGYELGLDPDGEKVTKGNNAIVYWGVANIENALKKLLEAGAETESEIQEVGGGVKVATVKDPFKNILGIIENPHFKIEN